MFKKLTENDIPACYNIIKNENLGWSEHSLLQSLQNGAHMLGGFESGAMTGFVLYTLAAEDAEILLIAVAKERRRKGIAGALIEEIINISGAEEIFLEVRRSNTAAQGLYLNHGFEKINERRDYYNSPVEDGFVFKKSIKT